MGLPVKTKKGSLAFAIFVLFFALCISTVAAYYSIVGLMAIFAGAAIPIAIMGGALEVGKLVSASWLYNNWRTSPILLKSYLTVAVIVLMIITSTGIFGFLSKAHLEQVGPKGDYQAKVEKLDFEISQQEKRIERSNKILNQFDAALKEYFDRGYVTRGLKERAKQTQEREALQKEISDANKLIDDLTTKKFNEQKEIRGIEAEVGPIKYVAQLIYGEKGKTEQNLDKAVRWMIMLLIFVFDPLAVLLVIAGNISIAQSKQKEEEEKPKPKQTATPPSNAPPLPPQSPILETLIVEKPKKEEEETATAANGQPLPVEITQSRDLRDTRIKVPIEEPKPFVVNIDEAIDKAFGSSSFNLNSPEGNRLKQLLKKELKKNKK